MSENLKVANNNATFSNFAYKWVAIPVYLTEASPVMRIIDTAEGKFEGAGGVCPPLAGV